ncbi:phage replisome organizer N-terminal domain-containing protein [Anaerococcus sp. Marseille-P3915]|uniref:phage replisome organizer N-terminal domain-containing protein n=1 Tax=Anaerococcus sp. Marseille-P3915 TaxID=2057799 RepID=UPI000D0B39DD|nr:phage replisome organizer N-terminal domain-containing protein [Anaerococcus sp. Marseille-P3915]
MGDSKRYYWLKLPEDFYDDDTIQWIEDQENGAAYVNFYLKLLLKSLSDDGRLIRYVGQRLMPYDVKSLARLTNTEQDTVRVALELFVNIGLVERLETGELYMSQIDEMIGKETEAARRKRKHRARKELTGGKKELPSGTMSQKNGTMSQNNRTMSQQCPTEQEQEQEQELEQEIRDKSKSSREEELTYKCYCQFIKNHSGIDDRNLFDKAMEQYGWRNILYTLVVIRDERKVKVSSFKYVLEMLRDVENYDDFTVSFVTNREIKELRKLYED